MEASSLTVIRFGPFELDLRTRELRKSGLKVRLQQQCVQILGMLIECPGELVTREQIQRKLWPDGTVVEFDHSINSAIKRLRQALGDDSEIPRFIETLPRRGYRFILPPQLFQPLSSAPGLTITPSASPSAASPDQDFADSIAVFPFESAGCDPEMEYLSDGITESLINSLSRLGRLRVVPRTTMFRYRERGADPIQAGRELRARVVLIGRVISRGEDFIVSAELIDVCGESQLWGEKYERKISGIFELHRDIVGEVGKRLRLKLSESEAVQLSQPPAQDREAYHLYLKAMYHSSKWTPEGLRKGAEFSWQAIEKDPAYAAPYAGLAGTFCAMGYFGVIAPVDAFPKAKAAALKALQIDDTCADAHLSLAVVRLFYDWDWSGADTEIQRGLNLAPNHAGAHFVYGKWLWAMGRIGEATAELQRALDLDPLSSAISFSLASAYYTAGQYDRAIEQFNKTIELDPSFIVAQRLLSVALAYNGLYEDAVKQAQKTLGSDVHGKVTLGLTHAIGGRAREAREIAEELGRHEPRWHLVQNLARIYALLGDSDEALNWLEKAYQERVSALVFLRNDPSFESLDGDPRFTDLLRRIGLPFVKTFRTEFG